MRAPGGEPGARPSIRPEVAAEIAARVAARLVKKLDEDPGLAERYTWTSEQSGAVRVTTDRGEVVTVEAPGGEVSSAAAVRCSCLLSPKCLHVLAVVARLPVFGGAPVPGGASPEPSAQSEPTAQLEARGPVEVDPAQRDAARRAFASASDLLAGGAQAAGAIAQAELLRAAHALRVAGLHRAAHAALRVVQMVRDLRDSKSEFSLGGLALALEDLLKATLLASSTGSLDRAWIGIARRSYDPVGALRLYGVFVEPVVTASGFAGVATYLADERGRLFTVSDVRPGSPSRAAATYHGGASIGDAVLEHRALCRAGLFVQQATASADGRLGSGAEVRAVRAGGVGWDEAPIAALFTAPIEAQLERAHAWQSEPELERRAGGDLLFLRGTIAGSTPQAVLLLVDSPGSPAMVKGRPGSRHRELLYITNLRRLSGAVGLEVSLIGRLRPRDPGAIALLALAPRAPPEGRLQAPAMTLPADLGARINLGLDPIPGAFLAAGGTDGQRLDGAAAEPAEPPDPMNPLIPLRRRLDRIALAGGSTIAAEVMAAVEREANGLERCMMPGGAAALRALAAAAIEATRGRGVDRAERLARAWLEAAIYEGAGTASILREAWRAALAPA